MKTKTIISCIAFAFLFIGLFFCSGKREEVGKNKEYIIGVKIYDYEGNLPKLFEEWRSLGINTALVSEFTDALVEALKAPSGGVIFWSWEALDKDPEKKDVIKALLDKKTGGIQ